MIAQAAVQLRSTPCPPWRFQHVLICLPGPVIIAPGKESGIEGYVYEQDGGQGYVFDSVKASYVLLLKQTL